MHTVGRHDEEQADTLLQCGRDMRSPIGPGLQLPLIEPNRDGGRRHHQTVGELARKVFAVRFGITDKKKIAHIWHLLAERTLVALESSAPAVNSCRN